MAEVDALFAIATIAPGLLAEARALGEPSEAAEPLPVYAPCAATGGTSWYRPPLRIQPGAAEPAAARSMRPVELI